MEAAASAASDREDQLRGEIRRAENRMQAAELTVSEASSHSGDSTKPLLRQIEAMAAAAVRLAGPARKLRKQQQGCCPLFARKVSGTVYLFNVLVQRKYSP